MNSKSLKTKIGFFLAGVLFLAMLLISMVWIMFLKKDMVEKEIVGLEMALDAVREWFETGWNVSESYPVPVNVLSRHDISCFFFQDAAGQIVRNGDEACFPHEILQEVEREARKTQERVVAFHGTVWAIFTFSHRQVVVGKTFYDGKGELLGVAMIGSSLEHLYSRIRREARVVFFYILINTIVFAGIGLLRMMQVVIKPIERFVVLARQHAPSATFDFFPASDDNEFAQLSSSLNQLFLRIREDNVKLRETVSKLECANLELERNRKEMIFAEKLAAVGRLSAGFAHEIGNPLGIIQGYVDLLGRSDLSYEERVQFAQNSHHELDRIKKLIHNLLDFSRPSNVPKLPVSIHEAIREVTHFVGMEKSFANCTIIRNLDAASDVVIADVDSLRQVLLNCLLNAGDAMENNERAKEIVISTRNPESETGIVSIIIKDSGRGIAAEDRPYVFDPFFTTKETGKGTGLGLFVCHTIIERLGGTITLDNNPSGGAEVCITLPVKDLETVPTHG